MRLCGVCRKPGHDKRSCPGKDAAPPPEPPAPLTWTRLKGNSHTFPAGRYYLGDICYPIGNDPVYDKVWGEQFTYSDGIYQRSDGLTFAVAGTAYGDGEYRGSDAFRYGVDAGVIGIVPVAMFDEAGFCRGYGDCTKPGAAGRIFDSATPVTFSWRSGVFHVEGGLYETINTTGDGEEDVDDY